MALLSAKDIEKIDDRQYEDVDVEEWGGTVRVMGLSGTDRDAYEAKAVALKNQGKDVELRLANFRVRLVAKCLVDESFERLFTDSQITALGKKNGDVIVRLFDVASRLSGMNRGAVEEGKGSSESGQSGSSTSD